MAEIRVVPEKRRGLGWLWVVLLLLVLAGVAYWLWSSGRLGGAPGADRAPATTTGQAPVPPADGIHDIARRAA